MKKTLSLLLALLLVLLSAGTVFAKPGNSKAEANNKHFAASKKHSKAAKAKIKQSVKEKYQAQKNEVEQKDRGFWDTENHWAHFSIRKMTAIGIFSGYPDGSFKPDQKLTQAEALSLIMRLADLDDEDTDEDGDENVDSYLGSIPGWVYKDAHKAAKKGLIKLDRFHSGVQASRAQTAVLIAKALGLKPVDVSKTPFKDGIYLSAEDIGYIMALYERGIIFGDTNGNFNPNSCITRAQMASILQRLLSEDYDEDNDEDDSKVESISLPKTAVIEQGQSITLIATVKYHGGNGDEDISWSSDNADLATVNDDGVVTAVQDKTGAVNIKASINSDGELLSAVCKVTVVDDIDAARGQLDATGSTKKLDGKVYQEYVFEINDKRINLASDKVKSISLQKGSATPVLMTPTSDSSLWFDVQSESDDYTVTVVQKDDDVYEAVLEWTAPSTVTAAKTGETREEAGYTYTEYELGDLDLSNFTRMYQIKPDGQVIQWGATDDENLWVKTTSQVSGTHVFLIKQSGNWYSASINL